MTTQHVVTVPAAPFYLDSGRLQVHQIPLAKDNLGWLLVNPLNGHCALVDGPSAGPYLTRISAEGWTLKAIFNTHIHGDHIGVNHSLGAQLDSVKVYGAAKTAAQIPGLSHPLRDGDQFDFEGEIFDVWLTEGHIDGHLSFICGGAVFCGDTLFAGGCGYLFDGPPEKMHESLTRLMGLPDPTRVCCAHEYTQDNLRFAWSVEPGNQALAERIQRVWILRSRGESAVPSTIAEERKTNPFARTSSSEMRRAMMKLFKKTDEVDSATMFHMIRRHKDSGTHKSLPDGELPLAMGAGNR
ncbi:MAG: hydroxyacylglutathione hydrolase [Myxococcales bacterium]|nr:hydroxyacylglutathione hydrolase [Myxococcales bacterium]